VPPALSLGGSRQCEYDQIGGRRHPHSQAIGQIRQFRMGNGVGDPDVFGGKQHRRARAARPGGRREPVVAVLVAARMLEAGGQQCRSRNAGLQRHSDVDVELGTGLRRSDLNRHAANQCVRRAPPVEQVGHESQRPFFRVNRIEARRFGPQGVES
jgi:hypothetical protein